LFAGLLQSAPAQTQRQYAQSPAPAPRPADINRNGALILIRSGHDRPRSGKQDRELHCLADLGVPGFQANTAARLADIFANQRRDNLDLSGLVVIDPQLHR
jgi:hypothetical protein